ncbi:MAG: hypothetical protein AAFQ73_13820 [Pseudomonadota bacterium]
MFERVIVRGVDGSETLLVLVSRDERTAYVCSPERMETTPRQDLEEWVVGFPLADVRYERSGGSLLENV